jgi:hypothetical protein
LYWPAVVKSISVGQSKCDISVVKLSAFRRTTALLDLMPEPAVVVHRAPPAGPKRLDGASGIQDETVRLRFEYGGTCKFMRSA